MRNKTIKGRTNQKNGTTRCAHLYIIEHVVCKRTRNVVCGSREERSEGSQPNTINHRVNGSMFGVTVGEKSRAYLRTMDVSTTTSPKTTIGTRHWTGTRLHLQHVFKQIHDSCLRVMPTHLFQPKFLKRKNQDIWRSDHDSYFSVPTVSTTSSTETAQKLNICTMQTLQTTTRSSLLKRQAEGDAPQDADRKATRHKANRRRLEPTGFIHTLQLFKQGFRLPTLMCSFVGIQITVCGEHLHNTGSTSMWSATIGQDGNVLANLSKPQVQRHRHGLELGGFPPFHLTLNLVVPFLCPPGQSVVPRTLGLWVAEPHPKLHDSAWH